MPRPDATPAKKSPAESGGGEEFASLLEATSGSCCRFEACFGLAMKVVVRRIRLFLFVAAMNTVGLALVLGSDGSSELPVRSGLVLLWVFAGHLAIIAAAQRELTSGPSRPNFSALDLLLRIPALFRIVAVIAILHAVASGASGIVMQSISGLPPGLRTLAQLLAIGVYLVALEYGFRLTRFALHEWVLGADSARQALAGSFRIAPGWLAGTWSLLGIFFTGFLILGFCWGFGQVAFLGVFVVTGKALPMVAAYVFGLGWTYLQLIWASLHLLQREASQC